MSRRTATVSLDEGEKLYASILGTLVNQTLSLKPEYSDELKPLMGAVRARNWPRVVKEVESLETQQYSSIEDLYVKTQLVALVKKLPFTRKQLPGIDPEATAWKKFLAAELRCKRINKRSSLLRYGVGFAYGDVIVDMRKYIRKVLGSRPNLSRIYELCDWGPGASVGVSGDRTNLARKFLARKWSCTSLALSYATQALWCNHHLRHLILREEGKDLVCYDREKFSDIVKSRVSLVTHNNICFVPKSYKTHRPIATEPMLNGFLQKGVDNYLRERLLSVGIDLSDQLSNQLLALEGSRGGFNPYATLDLSSASDSISYGIVRTLLPPAWFEFLNSLRAHQYKYRGTLHEYHKFVSMGNGFCFPLETLIFAAVCYAVCVSNSAPVDFRVYGDDIIVRQSEALKVIEVLKYLGFRTNVDKTNVVGDFRESCGADWYSGLDVRPVYVDYWPRDNRDLYKLHNTTFESPFPGLFETWRERCKRACPPEVRFVRPYHGTPDSCFTVATDEAMCSKFVSWSRSLQNWQWYEVLSTSVRDQLKGFDPTICCELEYIAVLRGASSRVPLAVRRKTRALVRRVSYWGPDYSFIVRTPT